MSVGFLPEAARGAETVSVSRARPLLPASAARLPWLTGLLALFALVASSPWAAAQLEWNRALSSAEPWRVWTGHFSHWSVDHLVWDLVIFGVFGGLLEARSRRDFVRVLLASTTLLGLVLPFAHPQMAFYRGLSGVDCALACALGLSRLRDAAAVDRIMGWAILGFVASKAGLEAMRAESFFVDQTAAGFVSLPSAHVIGAVVGLLAMALWHPARPDRRLNRSPGWADGTEAARVAGGRTDGANRGAPARLR